MNTFHSRNNKISQNIVCIIYDFAGVLTDDRIYANETGRVSMSG